MAGASRPLSVQRALSDSDRDSGDETEREGKEGGEKNPEQPKIQKEQAFWPRRV